MAVLSLKKKQPEGVKETEKQGQVDPEGWFKLLGFRMSRSFRKQVGLWVG